MSHQSHTVGTTEKSATKPVDVLAKVVDTCTQACSCCVDQQDTSDGKSSPKKLKKLVALYFTMVVVSTLAIYFLEHASIFSAVRTALVAAVGKTIAANWVSSFFN